MSVKKSSNRNPREEIKYETSGLRLLRKIGEVSQKQKMQKPEEGNKTITDPSDITKVGDITIKGAKRLSFATVIDYGREVSYPMIKLFLDYFNVINENKQKSDDGKFEILFFLTCNANFEYSLPLDFTNYQEEYRTVLIFEGELLNINLQRLYMDGKISHYFRIDSHDETYLNPEHIYDYFLVNAILKSSLKGSYFSLRSNPLEWEVKPLEPKTFGDIYLPQKIHSDISMYTELFIQTGKLLRYLLVGAPGSGKTESVLAISNELKSKGVTIVKTKICSEFVDKLRIAEILQPSIIILDDIDLSLGSRKKGLITRELEMFLDVMDGTEKIHGNVGFIAATNSLELLDIAAQRPGRFHKIISVNSLNKQNIQKIILKSLNKNFEQDEINDLIQFFISKDILEAFSDHKSTGAYIYNATNNIMLKIKALKLQSKVTSEWILSEIKDELDLMETIRKTDFLSDKLQSSSGKLGFNVSEEEDEDEEPVEGWSRASNKIRLYPNPMQV